MGFGTFSEPRGSLRSPNSRSCGAEKPGDGALPGGVWSKPRPPLRAGAVLAAGGDAEGGHLPAPRGHVRKPGGAQARQEAGQSAAEEVGGEVD